MNTKPGEEHLYIALTVILLLLSGYYRRRELNLHSATHWFGIVGEVIGALLIITALSVVLRRLIKKRKSTLKPAAWEKMSGRMFEDQIVIWLKMVGYQKVVKTEYFDNGIDIIAAKDGNLTGVQVKRANRPVGVNAVRAAVAGLSSYSCSKAMVVTNSTFTTAAVRLALKNNCLLIDGVNLKHTIYSKHLKIS